MASNWSLNVERFGVGGPYDYHSHTQTITNAQISWVAELITPFIYLGRLCTHVAQIGKRGTWRLFSYGFLLEGKLFTPINDWIPYNYRGFPFFAVLPD